MPTLATTVDGLKLPNPFIIGSGPPGTNLNVIAKAFREGWGAVIAKTVSLDASKVINVAPRYAKLHSADRQGSDRLGKHRADQRSQAFHLARGVQADARTSTPTACSSRRSWRSIRKDAWVEIVERCQDAGVDGFELNFSCPHGLPERKMGAAMGEDPEILEEVCGWVMSAAKKPVWAKMTPNVTHIEEPEPRGAAGGLPRHQRDQHDPQRDGRESRNAAARADRRRLHHARRLFLASRASRSRCAWSWRSRR